MRLFCAVLAALILAAPALAAGPERLVVGRYPGPVAWKLVTDEANANQRLREQLPANQTLKSYRDLLTDQAFLTKGGADPAEFLANIFANVGSACDAVRVNGPTTRMEGGYKVAYGQVYCGRQHGQSFGVHIFYKAIGGQGALYSISREFHVPVSDVGGVLSFDKSQAGLATALLSAESAASHYLTQSVYLCGGHSTDRRCR